jgi:formylglycine-generating enzyme required for sulfatase activity
MGNYGWYKDNAGKKTHPVGQKQPNAWGLHDMHGNVWEWVQDWYGDKYYTKDPAADPAGPASGASRVGRGGSWYSSARSCRVANRDGNSPDDRAGSDGFRLAFSPGQ